MRKTAKIAIFIFIFFGAFSLFNNLSPTTVSEQGQKTEQRNSLGTSYSLISKRSQFPIEEVAETKGVLVTRVIDGDTIEIEGGQKVRYIGIDTPETVDPRTSVQCYGKEAAAKNRELVEGKKVRLEKDITDKDKYNRLLRYVFVGEIFVNRYLVEQGYAFSSTYPPDVEYQELFQKAEKEAREANRGLWGSCGTVAGTKIVTPETGCVIKGNISSSGEKIYHMPEQRYYNKTVISENKGERWFCSEEEAVKAGWRKSKI